MQMMQTVVVLPVGVAVGVVTGVVVVMVGSGRIVMVVVVVVGQGEGVRVDQMVVTVYRTPILMMRIWCTVRYGGEKGDLLGV